MYFCPLATHTTFWVLEKSEYQDSNALMLKNVGLASSISRDIVLKLR